MKRIIKEPELKVIEFDCRACGCVFETDEPTFEERDFRAVALSRCPSCNLECGVNLNDL